MGGWDGLVQQVRLRLILTIVASRVYGHHHIIIIIIIIIIMLYSLTPPNVWITRSCTKDGIFTTLTPCIGITYG